MSKPIIVRTTKQVGTFPKDAQLGYRSESDAKSILGEGNYTVVSHQDGSPVEKKTSKSDKADSETKDA